MLQLCYVCNNPIISVIYSTGLLENSLNLVIIWVLNLVTIWVCGGMGRGWGWKALRKAVKGLSEVMVVYLGDG